MYASNVSVMIVYQCIKNGPMDNSTGPDGQPTAPSYASSIATRFSSRVTRSSRVRSSSGSWSSSAIRNFVIVSPDGDRGIRIDRTGTAISNRQRSAQLQRPAAIDIPVGFSNLSDTDAVSVGEEIQEHLFRADADDLLHRVEIVSDRDLQVVTVQRVKGLAHQLVRLAEGIRGRRHCLRLRPCGCGRQLVIDGTG